MEGGVWPSFSIESSIESRFTITNYGPCLEHLTTCTNHFLKIYNGGGGGMVALWRGEKNCIENIVQEIIPLPIHRDNGLMHGDSFPITRSSFICRFFLFKVVCNLTFIHSDSILITKVCDEGERANGLSLMYVSLKCLYHGFGVCISRRFRVF
jgi:hypothetical protein